MVSVVRSDNNAFNEVVIHHVKNIEWIKYHSFHVRKAFKILAGPVHIPVFPSSVDVFRVQSFRSYTQVPQVYRIHSLIRSKGPREDSLFLSFVPIPIMIQFRILSAVKWFLNAGSSNKYSPLCSIVTLLSRFLSFQCDSMESYHEFRCIRGFARATADLASSWLVVDECAR